MPAASRYAIVVSRPASPASCEWLFATLPTTTLPDCRRAGVAPRLRSAAGETRSSSSSCGPHFRGAGPVADRALDVEQHDIGAREERLERRRETVGIGRAARTAAQSVSAAMPRPDRIEVGAERDVAAGADANG